MVTPNFIFEPGISFMKTPQQESKGRRKVKWLQQREVWVLAETLSRLGSGNMALLTHSKRLLSASYRMVAPTERERIAF